MKVNYFYFLFSHYKLGEMGNKFYVILSGNVGGYIYD